MDNNLSIIIYLFDFDYEFISINILSCCFTVGTGTLLLN